MKHGDSHVPKWAFLVLLLIFLFFGETPVGDSEAPDATVATITMANYVHDLPSAQMTDNSPNSLEAK